MLKERKERTISTMIEPSLDDKIEYLAKTEERSKSFYIRKAIEQFLSKYPEPNTTA